MRQHNQTSLKESGDKDIEISLFKGCTASNSTAITIDALFNLIHTGEGYKEKIEQIRTTNNPAEKDTLKKTLPAVTVSGLFGNVRKKENLIAYSGLMQIDLDKVENIFEVRKNLETDKYCFALFLSPSGNGLKIIFRVGNDFKKHLKMFLAIEKHFLSNYGLQIDKSCKDVTRLMFLSHDENLFFNKNAIVFSPENNFEGKTFDKVFNNVTKTEKNTVDKVFNVNKTEEKTFDDVFYGLNKKDELKNGNRNNFLFKLACNCRDAGISTVFTEKKCLEKFLENDFSEKEIIDTVKSAFSYPQNKIKNKTKNKLTEGKGYSKIIQVEKYLNEKYEFRNNIVSTKIEFREKNSFEPFKELNENNVYCDLARNNLEISLTKLMSLLNSEFVPVFNPFIFYFSNLKKWDAKTEIDFIEKLCSYIPVKGVDRFKKQFKKMLVRCIVCALQDSFFNKHAFIFVHDQQGSGKTSFCRWLCPPALENYIAENINTDKDSQISLATNFLINMDELATLSKIEINALKSLISKDKINLRLPFDRRATVRPRRASFVGSTNKDEFLTDETGSLRWLCFELTAKINFDYKQDINIDDIWRQAYTLYIEDFDYKLTQEEIDENEKANKQFTVNTPEMELIQKMFTPGTKEKHNFFYTATDILREISKGDNIFVNCKSYAIGRAMKMAGFKRTQHYNENLKQSIYGYYVQKVCSI